MGGGNIAIILILLKTNYFPKNFLYLEEEIDSVMQMIEQKLFSPSKENFWENNLP